MVSIVSFCGCVDGGNGTTNTANEKAIIKISGSTTVLPIAKETAKRYMMKHPNVQIEVSGGGSGFGVKQVGQGLVDIGMASRDLKASEKETYPDLVVYNIGLDGVAVVVNPNNPVSSLTKEQVKKIYAGEITNWKEVGGTDEPITVYTRDELSGTRDTFWKLALNKNNISDRALVVASNGEMKAKVSADKNGMGYISVGYIDESVKPVALDGVNPTKENIKKGDYKVYRPLILITNGEPEPTVKEYINYILSPEGQKIVESKGFLSIN